MHRSTVSHTPTALIPPPASPTYFTLDGGLLAFLERAPYSMSASAYIAGQDKHSKAATRVEVLAFLKEYVVGKKPKACLRGSTVRVEECRTVYGIEGTTLVCVEVSSHRSREPFHVHHTSAVSQQEYVLRIMP